jgi:hypothetical protein
MADEISLHHLPFLLLLQSAALRDRPALALDLNYVARAYAETP